jgi:multiple sugar transport system permease protein
MDLAARAPAPAVVTRRHRRWKARDATRSFVLTFAVVIVLAVFLSPILRAVAVSLRTPEQVGQLDAPLYPATHGEFDYEGKTYDVYDVPVDGTVKQLALVRKGRDSSQFVDPANAAAGLITWQGSWRELTRAWTFAPQWSNYADVWNEINYPRLLFNTVALAIIGTLGTIVSCTLVAYGFARFRFPGRSLMFTLMIATRNAPPAVPALTSRPR